MDVARWLKPGKNVITVQVNAAGVETFQAMPSVGGFIAWGKFSGGGTEVDLATPGSWEVLKSDAWDREAENYNFAQGPIEHLDTARLEQEISGKGPALWKTPVPLKNQANWGELSRTHHSHAFARSEDLQASCLAGCLRGVQRVGFRGPPTPVAKEMKDRPLGEFLTYIQSPKRQTVVVRSQWFTQRLNGKVVAKRKAGPMWADEAQYSLKEGWNTLQGTFFDLALAGRSCSNFPWRLV